MKRIVVIATALAVMVTIGYAYERQPVNIVQDFGAEQGSTVWQESSWPGGAPGVSDSHNDEKAKTGDYSFLTDATIPNSSGIYLQRVNENINFDFSPIELSFDYNLEFVDNDWDKSEMFNLMLINNSSGDTLSYNWHHPDIQLNPDTEKAKRLSYNMPNFQNTWKTQFKNTSNDLSNKGWTGKEFNRLVLMAQGETYQSTFYGQAVWWDNVSVTALVDHDLLALDILNLDNLMPGVEWEFVSEWANNGTQNTSGATVEGIIYNSEGTEVFSQSDNITAIPETETREVSFGNVTLSEGTYTFVITTDYEDQSEQSNTMTVVKDVLGIEEQPAPRLLVGTPGIQRGFIRFAYSTPTATPYTLSIFDVVGRGVHSQSGQLAGCGQITCTPELTQGVYFWQVETEIGEESGKFVWVR